MRPPSPGLFGMRHAHAFPGRKIRGAGAHTEGKPRRAPPSTEDPALRPGRSTLLPGPAPSKPSKSRRIDALRRARKGALCRKGAGSRSPIAGFSLSRLIRTSGRGWDACGPATHGGGCRQYTAQEGTAIVIRVGGRFLPGPTGRMFFSRLAVRIHTPSGACAWMFMGKPGRCLPPCTQRSILAGLRQTQIYRSDVPARRRTGFRLSPATAPEEPASPQG